MPGLDPGIHHLRKKHFTKGMDCRIKPGNDREVEAATLPDSRGRRWMIANHPSNRTTVL
jgi:hypothetical protein